MEEILLALGVLVGGGSWGGLCGADGSRYRDDPVIETVLVHASWLRVWSHRNV